MLESDNNPVMLVYIHDRYVAMPMDAIAEILMNMKNGVVKKIPCLPYRRRCTWGHKSEAELIVEESHTIHRVDSSRVVIRGKQVRCAYP